MDARKNFIGGAWQDARSGRTDSVIDPATGEVITEVASSNEADVDAAVDSRGGRLRRRGPRPHPVSEPKRCCALADAIEDDADELVAIESRNVGKPIAAVPDEIEFLVDNLRFFAAGARTLTTQAPGEYLAGYTSILRREPLGVVGLDRPVELPADDGGLEDRARAGRRQHRRAEAVGAHAAHRAASWPSSPPTSSRPASSTWSPATASTAGPRWSPIPTSPSCRSPAR